MNLYQYAPNPTGWIDPLGLSTSSDAKTLRDNMINAGKIEPNYSNNAHHIVQSNATDPVSVATRNHLESNGININDPSNGVFLPNSSTTASNSGTNATPHSKVHTNSGREHISERLLDKDNKEDIESELNKIEQEMLSGDCPVLKEGKTWNEVK